MKKKATEMRKEDSKPIGIFDNTFWLLIGMVILIFIIICFFPKWFIQPTTNPKLDFSVSGQIGDTIGGIMGPFVAICAAILTFIAFWVQYKANKQQTRQFQAQAKDVSIDRFENRLSDLIKIHRDNLNEIEIANIHGRKTFIKMYDEIKLAYFGVKDALSILPNQSSKVIALKNDNASLLDIAYRIFYLGIGPNSNKLLYISLTDILDNTNIDALIGKMHSYRALQALNKPINIEGVNLKVSYPPFDGHISKLGHYFRHLYHIVKFIAEQDDNFIDEPQKRNYAKTVRAQLSDHEQLILFYNINSAFGIPWINDGYIRRFRMIKNMPVPLADFGVLPKEKFKEDIDFWQTGGQHFFQWDERRLSNVIDQSI